VPAKSPCRDEQGFVDTQAAHVVGQHLESLIDHYDHICQLAGNSRHIAIGSDLDGMFGKEQSPYDMDTIADLGALEDILRHRGYEPGDITNIMHGNWLRYLKEIWK